MEKNGQIRTKGQGPAAWQACQVSKAGNILMIFLDWHHKDIVRACGEANGTASITSRAEKIGLLFRTSHLGVHHWNPAAWSLENKKQEACKAGREAGERFLTGHRENPCAQLISNLFAQ
ncbi:uncharacterized protein LOC110364253 isoform X7 [Columba livia]|uniref:uncharacterized protein LOC110364253 isoform X7 n=1 Tax=Columba livia TaxID=8932 RepID=UPI0031BB07C9